MYWNTSVGIYSDSLYLWDKDLASYSFAGAIIVRITYGYEVQEKGDPILALAQSAVGYFSSFVEPGAYLVDFIPLRMSISHPSYQFEQYSPTAQ